MTNGGSLTPRVAATPPLLLGIKAMFCVGTVDRILGLDAIGVTLHYDLTQNTRPEAETRATFPDLQGVSLIMLHFVFSDFSTKM